MSKRHELLSAKKWHEKLWSKNPSIFKEEENYADIKTGKNR